MFGQNLCSRSQAENERCFVALTVGVHMLESYLARLVNSRRYVM
jgi:hypothetical protein